MPARFRLDELLRSHKPEPMSQSELSRQSGVSFTTINRMCANKTAQVSLATLDSLAATLGCRPGDIIEGEKPKARRAK
jgi:DNA-binding Xre family transcriptional regulator